MVPSLTEFIAVCLYVLLKNSKDLENFGICTRFVTMIKLCWRTNSEPTSNFEELPVVFAFFFFVWAEAAEPTPQHADN